VSGRRLAAVLFDMDGLLVDTEVLWTVAEHELAARVGGEFTPEIKRAMLGQGIDTAVPLMLSMLGVPDADPVDAARFLLDRVVGLFREPGAIVRQPGAVDLLAAVTAAGIPAALVSSSFRVLMEPVLDLLGREHFAVTVAGDEVRRRKPDPEPYRAAARLLGADPARCVVLEDSVSGATAGLAAGCPTVFIPSMPGLAPPAVPGSPARSVVLRPPAVLTLGSLHEVTVALFDGLVAARDVNLSVGPAGQEH
jgi:HAD superfamily hydrolase (TIGR01509 family)